MKEKLSRRVSVLCSLAVILFASAMVYVRSVSHICMADELRYFYIFDENSEHSYFRYMGFERAENLSDVAHSMANHYQGVNGRIPVHFVEQTVAAYDLLPLYYILNTIVFALTILLLARLCLRRQARSNPLAILAITLAMLYLFPSPGHIWTSPNLSINYLWPACATCAILLMLRRLDFRAYKLSAPSLAVWAVLAFLTGWGNEGYSFPLCGATFLYYAFNRRLISRRVLAVVIPLYVGVIIMLVSPGNWARASHTGDAATMVNAWLTMLASQKILWLLAAAAVGGLVFRRRAFVRFVRDNSLVVIAFVLSLLMSIVAHTGDRSFTPLVFFALIILLRVIAPLFRPMTKLRYAVFALLFAAMIVHQSFVTAEHLRQYRSIKAAADAYMTSPDGIVEYDYHRPPKWLEPYVFHIRPCDNDPVYEWSFLGYHLRHDRNRPLRALSPGAYRAARKAPPATH